MNAWKMPMDRIHGVGQSLNAAAALPGAISVGEKREIAAGACNCGSIKCCWPGWAQRPRVRPQVASDEYPLYNADYALYKDPTVAPNGRTQGCVVN